MNTTDIIHSLRSEDQQDFPKQTLTPETEFPDFVSASFVAPTLIHRSERTETYKLRGKDDHKEYLLKIRPISEKHIVDAEESTLKKLESIGIEAPHVALRQDTDTHCYLIREYIDGITLEDYAESVGVIREEDLVQIGIAILERLRRLHELPDPIIHRDIKPRNILLTNPDITRNTHFSEDHPALIVLIDYDTARTYKENATTDTRFLGTKETAAPEQYGFAQSDVRTDIFGVGKTLIYLATGTYEAAELDTRSYSTRLCHLLRACVSLDKDDRPASAIAMIHQMEKLLQKTRRPVLRFATTVVVVAVIGVGGFFLSRFTVQTTGEEHSVPVAVSGISALSGPVADDVQGTNVIEDTVEPTQTPLPTHQPKEKVDFGGSKSLELAVRTSLGVGKKKNITYADLAGIESIFAIGNASYTGADSYRNTDNEDQLLHNRGSYQEAETVTVEPGDISDISLLAEMPNLKKVFLSHQPLTDISPVTWSPLEDLAIVDCPVREYRPLARLKYLTRLVLMGCQGHDVSFLSELPDLTELCIGRMDLESLNALRDLPIQTLQFEKCFLADKGYAAIGQLPELSTLTLWNTTEDIIREIGSCPTVQRLEIYWTSLTGGLTAIGDMPSVRSLALNCATLDSMEGIENFRTRYIFPPSGVGVDWIKNCPSIEEIETTAIKRVDWDIIDRSNIKTVFVNKKQKEEIKKKLKNPSFEVKDAW
ncbi:MAG: hypothetical protein VZQ83_05185 [Eubacterium sp.]|nr:hypothetical protein [Eubacterium sp.]